MCPPIVSGIVTVNPADQLLVTVPSNNPRCLCESWPSFFLVSKLAKSLMIDTYRYAGVRKPTYLRILYRK